MRRRGRPRAGRCRRRAAPPPRRSGCRASPESRARLQPRSMPQRTPCVVGVTGGRLRRDPRHSLVMLRSRTHPRDVGAESPRSTEICGSSTDAGAERFARAQTRGGLRSSRCARPSAARARPGPTRPPAISSRPSASFRADVRRWCARHTAPSCRACAGRVLGGIGTRVAQTRRVSRTFSGVSLEAFASWRRYPTITRSTGTIGRAVPAGSRSPSHRPLDSSGSNPPTDSYASRRTSTQLGGYTGFMRNTCSRLTSAAASRATQSTFVVLLPCAHVAGECAFVDDASRDVDEVRERECRSGVGSLIEAFDQRGEEVVVPAGRPGP